MGYYSGVLGTLSGNVALRLTLNLRLNWGFVGFLVFLNFTVYY